MTTEPAHPDLTPTLSLEEFWDWLVGHCNCILRAGTPDAIIYDDEDFHWHLALEGPETLLIQVIRGKRLVGEILIPNESVSYVQAAASDQEEEVVFELITENEAERTASFFFVMSHSYETRESSEPHRVH